MLSCVAALLSLFLSFKFPRQTLPLNAPVGGSFFRNCYLASEIDSSHNSAQQQQQHDMAKTVSTVHCPLLQLAYGKLPYHTTYQVHEPTESSVPLMPCITDSKEDRGRKKDAEQGSKRKKTGEGNSVKTAEVLEVLRISWFS